MLTSARVVALSRMWTLSLLLVSLFLSRCCCLYEDQAFKFDWKLDNVGVPSHLVTSMDLIVTLDTLGRSLAAVDGESGRLHWRVLAAKNERLHDLVLAVADDAEDDHVAGRVTSILDSSVVMQRVFNLAKGHLTNEYMLGTMDEAFNEKEKKLVFDREDVVHVLSVRDKKLVIQTFDTEKNENSFELQTVVTNVDSTECLALSKTLVCLESETLLITQLPLHSKSKFKMVSTTQLGLTLKPTKAYKVNESKLGIGSGKDHLVIEFDSQGQMGKSELIGDSNLIAACSNGQNLGFKVEEQMVKLENKETSKIIEINTESPVFKIWPLCSDEHQKTLMTQLMVLTNAGRLLSVTPLGNLMWTREEALSNIRMIEFVSGGLTETEDGTYDQDTYIHVDSEGAGAVFQDIATHFMARLRHHLSLLHVQLRRLQRVKTEGIEALFRDNSALSLSDDFGLRKVIIVVGQGANVASIFGLDSKQGRVLWTIPLKENQIPSKLVIQRTALHYNQEALASLITLNEKNHPQILIFDPLNGQVLDTKVYDQPLVQSVLLHHEDEEHIRPLLLVLGDNVVVTVPEKSPIDTNTFIVINTENTLKGHQVTRRNANAEDYELRPLWNLRLGDGVKIVRIAAKSTLESVHSQGRVMADRSVLFKYVNPNLALLLAEQPGDEDSKSGSLEVFLIDLVSGRIVFSAVHKRVLGPYHAVHSENWAVYSIYNEKARRTELVSLELFEGPVQSNSSVFSSLSNPTASLNPLVERQTFILPIHVAAMVDSMTAKGITSKHVLVADEVSGSILDLPKNFLDPRRPTEGMPAHQREPGLPPYVPEVNVPDEAKLNYNRSVALVKGIVSTPTGLESTSIVVVYGLDVYCTRIAPSKGFDLLKDDFDYYIISLVLSSLVVAAVVTKKLAQNKSLKQAWK